MYVLIRRIIVFPRAQIQFILYRNFTSTCVYPKGNSGKSLDVAMLLLPSGLFIYFIVFGKLTSTTYIPTIIIQWNRKKYIRLLTVSSNRLSSLFFADLAYTTTAYASYSGRMSSFATRHACACLALAFYL